MRTFPVSITYENQKILDGLGAQLLKIITIKAISDRIKLGYIHSPIMEIQPTQLDTYQNATERKEFLEQVNRIFYFQSTSENSFTDIKSIDVLTRKILLKEIVNALLYKKKILLKVDIPYYVSRGNYRMFKKIRESDILQTQKINQEQKTIVIHFRQGTNPAHIDPGRKYSRMLPFRYFEIQIKKILSKYPQYHFKIFILTDAPKEPFIYYPPFDKVKMWQDMGYSLDQNYGIVVKALDFHNSFLEKSPDVSVLSGGNPIEALRIMASADFLIMSESALSYVGGILNFQGTCVVPNQYKPGQLKAWTSSKSFLV